MNKILPAKSKKSLLYDRGIGTLLVWDKKTTDFWCKYDLTGTRNILANSGGVITGTDLFTIKSCDFVTLAKVRSGRWNSCKPISVNYNTL